MTDLPGFNSVSGLIADYNYGIELQLINVDTNDIYAIANTNENAMSTPDFDARVNAYDHKRSLFYKQINDTGSPINFEIRLQA